MDDSLIEETKDHWRQLRGMTYDLLDAIKDADLSKKLSFPESQDVQYQFWCMLGTQESWTSLLISGVWGDWSCSLDKEDVKQVSVERIKRQMHKGDKQLFEALKGDNLLRKFENGTTPLMNYMILVEHESHHQGQLINSIYAHHLPIPESWEAKWALTREG